jgi:hypothetical protein
MKKSKHNPLAPFLFPIFVTLILLYFLTAISNLNQGQSSEGKQQLENAIKKAAVSCYATEGIYPPNLQHLIDYYGIQINTDLYTVVYEAIASNLMPDITVLDNES